MVPVALLTLSLADAARAQAPEDFHSGEFRNTADTLPAGELVIHPFLPSTIGVGEHLDLKTTPLGWIGGPNAFLELGLASGSRGALSIEPQASARWTFDTATAGARLHGTLRFGDDGIRRLNLSAGGGVQRSVVVAIEPDGTILTLDAGTGPWIPVDLGYDLGVSDHQIVRFEAATDVGGFTYGLESGWAGVNYNHAFGAVRLSVGAMVVYGGSTLDAMLDLIGIHTGGVLPLPSFEIWVRI